MVLPVMFVNGQDDKNFKHLFRDAEFYALSEEYNEAIEVYKELLEMDSDNSNIHYLLGNSLLSIDGKNDNAIDHLEKAIISTSKDYREGSYKEKNAPVIAYFLLAKAYHVSNNFEKAIEAYGNYKRNLDLFQFAEIEFVNRQIKSCSLAVGMIDNPVDAGINPMFKLGDGNSSSRNPVVSGDNSILIYAVNSAAGNSIVMLTKRGRSWSDPISLDSELEGNFSPVSLSYDGTELYLVQQDYYESNIFVSYFRNSNWSRAEKLNSNINTRYYETHASISADGKSLYFASNRKGGWGGLDLYRSERDSTGKWLEAVNLGFNINTYYNEDTPFICMNDSTLFYSSEGFVSMGGYDVVTSTVDEEGDWSIPLNVGYPISTSDDNLFYNPGWDGKDGFYSMQSDANDTISEIYTVSLEPGSEGHGIAYGGQESERQGSLPDYYYIQNIILFDYAEYFLNDDALRELERLSFIMQKYSEIEIELTGHTDSKGSDKYNEELSANRAQSVSKYLTDKGISPIRITMKGIGETNPLAINQFDDGTDAPGGRVLNRNVSIKISNVLEDKIRMTEVFVPDRLLPMQDRVYSVFLTESGGVLKSIPDEISGESVSNIKTDKSMLYTVGNFEQRIDAINLLNEVIDNGYPDAYIMEKRNFEYTIRKRMEGEKYKELTYMIQIMALKKAVDISYFSKLGDVKEYVGKDGFHRYVYGEFKSINIATAALSMVRIIGYKDAFIKPLGHYEKLSLH